MDELKYCFKCGEKLSVDVVYCQKCGKNLSISNPEYSKILRIIIMVMSIFNIMGTLDGIIEVQIGETTWTIMQILRVVISPILSFIYAYVSLTPHDFDSRFRLNLLDKSRFRLFTYILIGVFLISIFIFPSS